MDLNPRKKRKGKARNRSGGRGGNIIKTPSSSDRVNNDDDLFGNLDGIHDDDSPGRVGQNDGGGSGSDSSRFSAGDDDGAGERGRESRRHRHDGNSGRGGQRKVEQKRQREKDALADWQRRKDDSARECIHVDDDDGCFDGVRIDKVNNPRQEEYLNDVKKKLGGDDDDDYHQSTAGPAAKSRQRKREFRGNAHEKKSSMARSLSPPNNSPRRILNRDRNNDRWGRDRGYSGRDAAQAGLASYTGDPLDQARSQQAANAGRSAKVVEDVTDSAEKLEVAARRRRGKPAGTTSQMMGTALTNGFGMLRRGGIGKGSMTSYRRDRREKQAGAALVRQTANDECSPARPLSGEKRKPLHGSDHDEEDGRSSRKKQHGPKDSRETAIDVDEDNGSMDHSVLSVDASRGEGYNDDSVHVLAAIEACETRPEPKDYEYLNTPKVKSSSSLWDEKTTKDALKGMANFGLTKKPGDSGNKNRTRVARLAPMFTPKNKTDTKMKGGPVADIHGHLKKSKRVDDIEDESAPILTSGIRGRTRSTADCTLDQTAPKADEWICTHRANDAGIRPRRKASQSNATRSKIKSQGGIFNNDDNHDDFEFHSERTLSSSSRERKNKQKKTKTKQSKLTRCPNGHRRKTRSSSTSIGGTNDIITIDSSSDEDDVSVDYADDSPMSVAEGCSRRKRAVGDMAFIDAARIAVGKKVFKSKCELSFQFGTKNPYVMFSFWDDGKKSEHCVYLKHDELKEVRYYIAGDEDTAEGGDIDGSMTVIAFRITPTDKNSFNKFPNAYDQAESTGRDDTGRHYISVEVRDADDFRAMLIQMRQHPDLQIWCTEGSEIQFGDLEKYAQALLESNRKERENRLSIAGRTRSGGNKKKKNNSDDKTLLVYPFEVDKPSLAEAASGLTELGGDFLGVEGVHAAGKLCDADMHDQSDGGGDSDDNARSTRTHYVTIRQDDVDRLSPGEFLNDTLVDFWMRWISREEPRQPDSSVHFFTSHFMTTLKNDGPEAVASWTAKKKINVFGKKFIFVPVNADLHWSLLVIVNPGLIANFFDDDIPQSEEHSCILFLDSLNMHSKKTYAKHIRKWLNCEWQRLGKGQIGGEDEPFNVSSMGLRSPKIPYQENGCDCGVFVCRYAYNLYVMRHQKFTFTDIEAKPFFSELITDGPAFQFDMFDIARIRKEMRTLIYNLSKPYLRMKERKKANKKVAKLRDSKSKKQQESFQNGSNDATAAKLGKEIMRTGSTTATSIEDGGTSEEVTSGATAEKEEDSDVNNMSSCAEKETKGHENDGHTERLHVATTEMEGDVMMPSPEEKENILQTIGSQNSINAVAATMNDGDGLFITSEIL